MTKLNRRDFLNILPYLASALALSPFTKLRLQPKTVASSVKSSPNIIIFLFDAMSAENLSAYGYRRRTTPNLEKFAKTATIFNTHYSAANFTTPGTASLLTGLYPWTHRAINDAGLVARNRENQNLFAAVGGGYSRLAFSQNTWVDYLFSQFRHDIEHIIPPSSFSLVGQTVANHLGGKIATGLRAYDDFLFKYDGELPGSLVFGLIDKAIIRREQIITENKEIKHYPLGLPHTQYANYFILEDVFDGLMTIINELTSPSFSYLHLWPPHEPFRPAQDFIHQFVDGWAPKSKPQHILGGDNLPSVEKSRRQLYDDYIANVDAEFGRLLNFLDRKGMREQSYVVVTSDHGQLFERGVVGHATPLLYDPVVRVPLLISAPGQTARQDVDTPTSSVDLLPTLAHLVSGQKPDWSEGELLPLFGGQESNDRSIFMMDAKNNPAFAPLTLASFAMRKGIYKLIYYKGYSEYDKKDVFELYDIVNDPEELNDLYSENSPIAGSMRQELLAKVESVNAKYKH